MLFDPEVWQITVRSLQIPVIATGICLFIGLPTGTWLVHGNFRGRWSGSGKDAVARGAVATSGCVDGRVGFRDFRGGRIDQVGTVEQIKSKPDDETVKAFFQELPQ